MKRKIKADTDWTHGYVHYLVEWLDNEAYHYELDIKDINNIKIEPGFRIELSFHGQEPEMMPKVFVELLFESEQIYLNPIFKDFPDIDTEDFSYYDSAEYYIGRWTKLGKFASECRKQEFYEDNNMYNDEDEE